MDDKPAPSTPAGTWTPNGVAFAWQPKEALRKIRDNLDSRGMVSSALAVYAALTELASNHGGSAAFQATHQQIAHLCGLTDRTVRSRLTDLSRLGLVEIDSPALKVPCLYTLVPFGNNFRTFGKQRSPSLSDNRRKKEERRSADSASPSSGGKDHQEFICRWTKAYRQHFGFDYRFDGGKDGKAVKALLETTKLRPTELVDLAAAAWAHLKDPATFGCRNSGTIAGFNSQFNRIRPELTPNLMPKPNVPNL